MLRPRSAQREEAQRRPAESEVPGTEMNRLHDWARPLLLENGIQKETPIQLVLFFYPPSFIIRKM
jgi:hypothetical protein